jgi:SRSO17 transposase
MEAAAEQIIVRDTLVTERRISGCVNRLEAFLGRYQPLMQRDEQRAHMQVYVEGLVGDLERKSIEPIATAHGLYRRPLQHYIGAGAWSDTTTRDEMRSHIVDEISAPDGVLIIDGAAVPKSGKDSVGVARLWCGRLGKVENCQVGIYLAYSSRESRVLLDGQLYLPEDWANDPARREKTYVPDEVEFKKSWQLADDLLLRHGPKVPHAWIVGDDEFGRPTEFRDKLADRHEPYLFEVPSNTVVRRPSDWPGRASKWRSVRKRKERVPPDKWKRLKIRDGEKGPIEVLAYSTRVETKREGAPARQEVLLIVQRVDCAKAQYFLAPKGTPRDTPLLVGVMSRRHDVEEVFAYAKGEVGLDHYEVRSWVGWHHHLTLSMLSLWFLTLERRRLGEKLQP